MTADQQIHLEGLLAVARGTRAAARAYLPEPERETTPGVGSEGPTTWEDNLRERCNSDYHASELLIAWEDARNAAWVYLIELRVPEYYTALFRKQATQYRWIKSDDIQAEVMFLLPFFIERYPGKEGGTFQRYAARGVLQRLRVWAAQQGPVQVPEKVARNLNLKRVRHGAEEILAPEQEREDHADEE
jgi:hypothetical protein